MSWLGNVGVLVAVTLGDEGESVMLATLAGDVTPVVPATLTQTVAIYTTSPDGKHFVYSANSGDGSFVLYAIDMQEPSAPSMPEQLGVSNTSPHLSFVWSSDSHWLAYGVPGGSPAIFVWSPESDALPTAISGPEDQYTPLYSFSPTNDAFVCQVASTEVPSRLLLTPLSVTTTDGVVSEATVGEPVELAGGEGVSPATWSPGGDYITYTTDERSLLQAVDAGVGGERTDLEGWGPGCSLEWADAEHFVQTTCLEVEPEFHLVDVSNDLASTSIGAAPTASVYAGASCLVISDGTLLSVGPALPNAVFEPLETEDYSVMRVRIHPEGKGVAWLSQDNVVRWQPLTDCAPTPGSTVTISGLAEVPSTLTLLPD
jgi:WD40 repeat protein